MTILKSPSPADDLAQPAEASHLMQFTTDPAELGGTVSRYFSEGLKRGETAFAIATPDHWEEFRKGLESRGHPPEKLQQDGRLAVRDAREILATFMRDGMPDETLFRKALGPRLSELAGRGSNVRAFSDLGSILWQERRTDAAVRLEELWNGLRDTRRFTLLCAYEGYALAPDFHGRAAEEVFEAHTHVLPVNVDRLTGAVDRAFDEVFGAGRAAALRPLIAADRGRIAVMAGAQASLLWLQSNLPDWTDAVLAAARKHYSGVAAR